MMMKRKAFKAGDRVRLTKRVSEGRSKQNLGVPSGAGKVIDVSPPPHCVVGGWICVRFPGMETDVWPADSLKKM